MKKGQKPKPDFLNRLLGNSFSSMEKLGDPVMRPFLQDVIQFEGLSKALAGQVSSLGRASFIFRGLPSIYFHFGQPAHDSWPLPLCRSFCQRCNAPTPPSWW